jgi:hypothetical protein
MTAIRAKHLCLEAALEYLAMGWSPIPICPPDHEGCPKPHVNTCKRPGKQPLIEWKTYQERLPSEREVRLLFSRYPSCNVGIILGSVSRLIGIDADGPEALNLLRELSCDLETPTLEFTTPSGGKRFLFETPKGIIVPKRRFDRGDSHLIILGEGTYTVMPPSVHPNGDKYQWPQ